LYFHVECMLYSLVLKNVIASHDVAEEALIYSYGRSFNGFAATLSAAEVEALTSKSAKFPNSSWLCVVQFGDIRFCENWNTN
jgi:Peptidase inhibitor I9